MNTITTKDGTSIFYKDWGTGPTVVFSHGWPLNADAWDPQMLFLGQNGYRVIAHDRRGHGRSSQTWDGNNMDTYADDLGSLLEQLNLKDVTLVGHSTGGGEVVRYIGRHGTQRVSKAVLIGAVPPLMLKTEKNPGGLPLSVFDGIRAGVTADRSQFFKDLTTPFYGYNKPDANISRGYQGCILATGNAGIDCWSIRLHQSLFGDGLHRGSREDRCANLDPAWGCRPDRAHSRFGALVCETHQELHLEGLSGRAARDVHYAGGHGECRSSRIPEKGRSSGSMNIGWPGLPVLPLLLSNRWFF